MGCSMTHENDCNVYAIDCGGEFVLIDSGSGMETGRLVENLEQDGIPLGRVTHLLLTHGHLDHSGGSRWLHDRLHLRVAASAGTASALEAGNEDAISLASAKRAGIYPADVCFRACAVDRTLRDEEEISVGDCVIQVLEASGHSGDMINFLVRRGSRRDLFCGDTVFHGGRILLQDVADCDVHAYTRTLRKLAGLKIDGLYPGHLTWSVNGGQRHIDKAGEYLERLLLPPNLI